MCAALHPHPCIHYPGYQFLDPGKVPFLVFNIKATNCASLYEALKTEANNHFFHLTQYKECQVQHQATLSRPL